MKFYVKNLFGIAVIFMALNSTPVKALMITFEGSGDQGNVVMYQDGFTFTFNIDPEDGYTRGWGIFSDSFVGYDGPYTHNGTTRYMLSGGSPGSVTMSQTDGGAFSLQGFDAATKFPGLTGTINITGNLFGGGSVFASAPISENFSPFLLNGFNNLASVNFAESISGNSWETPGLSLDNLVINETAVVPVPPALWLFGSGLMGLIGMARRKAA